MLWCDVMECDVMCCDVTWCDYVIWCYVMWCDVMWGDWMTCDLMLLFISNNVYVRSCNAMLRNVINCDVTTCGVAFYKCDARPWTVTLFWQILGFLYVMKCYAFFVNAMLCHFMLNNIMNWDVILCNVTLLGVLCFWGRTKTSNY